MIVPKLKDEAFLQNVKDANEPNRFYLWWLGQSGYLVKWQGRFLLIDPYLSDSLTRKYAGTDKEHIRMTERVVNPGRMDFIDVVSSSHNHTDHLDGETLKTLLAANEDLKLIIPAAKRDFVCERLDIEQGKPIGIDAGERVDVCGFGFTAVVAAHEEIDRDEMGRYRFLGYVISFGPWQIYHSGDTVLYDGIENTLKTFSIDVAILPINGRNAKRRVPGNLNAKEAVGLAKQIEARVVLPCHYDMFTFNTTDVAEFVSEARKQDQNYAVLSCGQRWSSDVNR